MRKPRDFDAELRALNERAKQLQTRKVQQLGEVVISTGADALPLEQLAGLLLGALDTKDAGTREGWCKRGTAFFQRARCAVPGAQDRRGSGAQGEDGASSDRN
jgi:hypothetical protein